MQSKPPIKTSNQIDYLPIFIHYYPGIISKKNPNPFGHIAIQLGDTYLSFYGGEEDYSETLSVRDEKAIEMEIETYGNEHAAIPLPNPESHVDIEDIIKVWQKTWRTDQYDPLKKNCAHSVIYCVDKLGLMDQKSATTLLNDRGLRPHSIANIFCDIHLKNIQDQRNSIIKERKINPIKKIELLIDNDISRLSAEITQQLASHKAIDISVKQEKILALIKLKKKLIQLKIPDIQTELTVEKHNQSTGMIRNKTADHIEECLILLSKINPENYKKCESEYINDKIEKNIIISKIIYYLIQRNQLIAKAKKIRNPHYTKAIKALIVRDYQAILDSINTKFTISIENKYKKLNEVTELTLSIFQKITDFQDTMDKKNKKSISPREILVNQLMAKYKDELKKLMLSVYFDYTEKSTSLALLGTPKTASLRSIHHIIENLYSIENNTPATAKNDIQLFFSTYFELHEIIDKNKKLLHIKRQGELNPILDKINIIFTYIGRNLTNMNDAIYSTNNIFPGLMKHIENIETIFNPGDEKFSNEATTQINKLKKLLVDKKQARFISHTTESDTKISPNEATKIAIAQRSEDSKDIKTIDLDSKQNVAPKHEKSFNSHAYLEWLTYQFQKILFSKKNKEEASFAREMLIKLYQHESEYMIKTPEEIFMEFINDNIKSKWNLFLNKIILEKSWLKDEPPTQKNIDNKNETLTPVPFEHQLELVLKEKALLKQEKQESEDIIKQKSDAVINMLNENPEKFTIEHQMGLLLNKIDSLKREPDTAPRLIDYDEIIIHKDITNTKAEILLQQLKTAIMKIPEKNPIGAHLQNCIQQLYSFIDYKIYNFSQALSELASQINNAKKLASSPLAQQLESWIQILQSPLKNTAKKDEKYPSPATSLYSLFNENDEKNKSPIRRAAEKNHKPDFSTQLLIAIMNLVEDKRNTAAWADLPRKSKPLHDKSPTKVPELIHTLYSKIAVASDSKKHNDVLNEVINILKTELKANDKHLRIFLNSDEKIKLSPNWKSKFTENKPSWLLLFYLGITALKEKPKAYPLNMEKITPESVWKIGLDYLEANKKQIESLYFTLPIPNSMLKKE